MSQGSASPPDFNGRRLSIDLHHEVDEVRIALAGELDIGSAMDLDEALIAAERSGASRIVLDLSELVFLDSTGLRAILSAELRASVDGFHLVLVPGPERVQRLFALTGTAEFLHFTDGETPPDNVRHMPSEPD